MGERGKAMSGHPDKIAEHYRELAAEEVALARAAVTNEARASITRWRLSIGALAQTAEDEVIERPPVPILGNPPHDLGRHRGLSSTGLTGNAGSHGG